MAHNILKRWMTRSTPTERARLAKLSKTTEGNLYQIAGGYRTKGKVSTSPETARNIELAAAKLHRDGLPLVLRQDLCQACGRCEYAKQVKK